MDNVTFYKFVELKNLPELKERILSFCKERDIKGKILLADEGINGYLTGEKDSIKEFEEFMHEMPEFSELWLKHNVTERYNSKRMLVKIRKEIITFRQKIDMENTGKYMSPKELDDLYASGEDFLIIDTRNDYEYDVGHFKDAVKMDIRQFTDYPKEVSKLKEKAKGKKVVTYCTGGVRCEKATAWMKENGFDDVYQVDGGIINYGIERGQSNWEGRCFVFDDRGAINIDPKDQNDDYVQCSVCYVPCEIERTCPQCGKKFIMCNDCDPLLEGCCSKFCRNKLRMKNLDAHSHDEKSLKMASS